MILRAIVRTLCTIELGYYTGQNKGRQNRRRMTRIYSSRLECLGNVVFGIPHEHFFDFGAEFFFSGAEFLGSPLNGAE